MIKDKEIEIINYYELEKYLEKSLSKKIEIPNPSLNIKVYKYTSIEEEINATCIKIINLIKNNIPLNKIFLGNIDDDYIFLLKKIFSFYNIPLNIDLKESIYSTKVVKDYLLTNELDLEDISKNSINKKIISCLNKISNLEDND